MCIDNFICLSEAPFGLENLLGDNTSKFGANSIKTEGAGEDILHLVLRITDTY